MKSIRNGLPAFFAAAALVVAMAWHSTAHAQATAQSAAGLSDPCPVKGEDWRGKAFYEILFMNREANGGAIGNYFNSLGNTFDASNEVMDTRFKVLNAEALKKEYGSDGVFFNGPRRFVANGFTGMAFDGCKRRIIGTIPLYLYGTFEVPSFNDFVSGPPVAYKVLVSKRTNTFFFKAGEQVHELITPDGAVYTMFSLSLKTDPNNTIENLSTLGKRLTLPTGWKYRTRALETDMVLSSRYDANPPNSIVLDQFEGNYQHNPDAR
ncbi:MAG: hypothetical protein IBJ17_17905 [Reyranella sp.]|nr:hypothetical protein [Reyranella sp.]